MVLSHPFTWQVWKQYQQQHQKYITRNFNQLNWKKVALRDIYSNSEKNGIEKCTLSDYNHHYAVEFLECDVPNSTKALHWED